MKRILVLVSLTALGGCGAHASAVKTTPTPRPSPAPTIRPLTVAQARTYVLSQLPLLRSVELRKVEQVGRITVDCAPPDGRVDCELRAPYRRLSECGLYTDTITLVRGPKGNIVRRGGIRETNVAQICHIGPGGQPVP